MRECGHFQFQRDYPYCAASAHGDAVGRAMRKEHERQERQAGRDARANAPGPVGGWLAASKGARQAEGGGLLPVEKPVALLLGVALVGGVAVELLRQMPLATRVLLAVGVIAAIAGTTWSRWHARKATRAGDINPAIGPVPTAPPPTAPPGWYADPDGSGMLRWWDGATWTQSPPR